MRSLARFTALTIFAGCLAAMPPVWGQAGVSSASGEVVDTAGNPIVGATVKFSPSGNPSQSYNGKTNKKGLYAIPGLFTPQEKDTWIVEVLFEGYELVEAVVETRNVNKVLNIPGDKFPVKDNKVLGFGIPKLGTAKVDLKLATAAEMAEKRAAGGAAPAAGGAAAPPVAESKDPWLEATRLSSAGDYTGALPLFEEAIAADAASVERRETYARVLAHLERYDDASAQLDAAIGLAPDRVETRLLQAQVKARQGDLEAARATLEAARAAAPQDVRIEESLAEVAAEAGDVEAQIASYQAITKLRPDDAKGWVALGDLYAETGRMKESEAAYQKVIDLDPQNAYLTYYNLASFDLNKKGATDQDRQRAIAALRRAIEIKPDFAQAYKELGLALVGAGDNTGAKQALEKYVSLKPDAPDAAQMKAIAATL